MMMMMMMNIFTIFDPASSPNLSLNWLSMLLIFFTIPLTLWTQPSRSIMLMYTLMNYLFKEFKILINYSHSNLILLISLFFIILINNFMGLFPYIFTASSHMCFNMSISMSLWLSIMIYSILNYFNNLCAHLTPKGTPPPLMPFMVMIESISLLIRPMTLAIRLTANMIAGHLLMSLLGSSGQSSTVSNLPWIMITQFMLLTLEISVSIIQSYVFTILCTLYMSET